MRKGLLVSLVVLMISTITISVSANEGRVDLDEGMVSDVSDEDDVDYNGWSRDTKYMDINGNTIESGLGFQLDYDTRPDVHATYNIGDYDLSTFNATFTLDGRYNTGDLGKSQLKVYADQHEIFSKKIKNSTEVFNVQESIPESTEEITVELVFNEGSQGSHRVIMYDTHLTNELEFADVKEKASLENVGVSDYSNDSDFSYVNYNDDVMTMANGEMVSRGYLLRKGYDTRSNTHITFPVSDYDLEVLKTKVSVDQNWSSGDRGSSQITVFADDTQLYTKNFNNDSGVEELELSLPKDTEYITFYGTFDSGSQGTHRLNVEDPHLTEGDYLPNKEVRSLVDIGVANSSDSDDYTMNSYGSLPSVNANEQLIAKEVQLTEDYFRDDQETPYINFYIADQNLDYLVTTVSPDLKYVSGNRGESHMRILADDKVLWEKEITNTSEAEELVLEIPNDTEYIQFEGDFVEGNDQYRRILFQDPVLTDSPSEDSSNKLFTDLSDSHRFFDEIEYLSSENIISGYSDGSFGANDSVSRAAAAIMIGRALDLDGNQKDTSFTDVNHGNTASGYIEAASKEGIIQGFPDGSFRPSEQVTRAQMAIFLNRAFDLVEGNNVGFSDVDNTMQAFDAIQNMAQNDITNGYPDNTYRPDNVVNRGEFSAFMYRVLAN